MMILATNFHMALRQDLLAKNTTSENTKKLFWNDVPTKKSSTSSGKTSQALPLVVMVTHRENLGLVRHASEMFV